MKKLAILAGGAALVAGLAACSSSGTTATAPRSAAVAVTSKSGIEVLTGQVTGVDVFAHNITMPLKFTGPVNTTGTFSPPSGNATHEAFAFKTAAGNMAANAIVLNPNAASKIINAAQCQFSVTFNVSYTIDGAKSTGPFAGATGSGKATATFTADAPRLSSGQCDLNAHPLTGATDVFSAAGPLTLK